MGIEEDMAKGLRCIGNFYDAADPVAFEHVLQLVLEQALHNTTLHIELLDDAGEPVVSDLAYSFTDMRTEVHDPQWVHTMRWGNAPDTVYVDPLPTYAFTVHSTPPRKLDSIVLNPGVHNVLTVPNMGQGHLTPQFARGVRTDYGSFDVEWRMSDSASFFASPIGQELRLQGTYDAFPRTLHPCAERGSPRKQAKRSGNSGARLLVVQTATSGHAVVVDAQTLQPVFQFEPGQLVGKHTLQPGDYTLIFRARNARGTLYSIRESFTIASGNTTNLNIHG